MILYDWPFAGLVLALLLLVWLACERRPAGAPPRWRDPASVLPLLWPMYLLHQFEEHGIDVLGRHYAFLADLCQVVAPGKDLASCPVDPSFLFSVNVVGCWIAFTLPLIFRRSNPLVAACAWGIPLINGVIHVVSALAHGAYNAGVLTSLLLFAPLCAWTLHLMLRSGALTKRQLLRIVGTGIAAHALLLGSLFLFGGGLISHPALLVINGLNGLMPLVFGLTFTKRPTAAPLKS